ncbi:MAG: peptide ABC transporter substrate-binding protein [Burkholderiales bacterium]|nr:peptide ABC transporter substrate-binding protein [Burkholderiales bacterium]
MYKIKPLLFQLSIIGASTLIYGCEHSATRPLDTIRIDVGAEVPSLDPTKAEDVNSVRIMYDLFAGLLDFNQKNEIIPGMAKSWDISADGKTYTFHLRDGLKFSDGSPITAKDFVYSWQRLVDPKVGSSYSFLLSNVINGQSIIDGKKSLATLGVKASDDKTFVVTLNNPDSSFLDKVSLPNLYVIPEKVIKQYGDSWTNPSNIISSGAYKIKEHVVNGYILADKNPNYYDAKSVTIPHVKYLPYVDLNSSVAAYKTGDLDMTFQMLPVDQYKQLKEEYKDQVHTIQQEALSYFEYNMQDPILGKNIKLRQALSMAVDRDALVNDVLQDGKSPLYAVVTPTIGHGEYANLTYPWVKLNREDRLKQAKKLYTEAGYSASKPYKVTITYNTNEMYKKVSIALAAMWKENLGVEVETQNQDWKTFLQTRHKGAYQIARGGWFADYNNITTYTLLYQCNSPQNDTHWCDSDYDKLIVKGDIERDSIKQQQYYFNALQRAQDAYISIPLFQFSYSRMIKPYVSGYDLENNYLDHMQTKWLKLDK